MNRISQIHSAASLKRVHTRTRARAYTQSTINYNYYMQEKLLMMKAVAWSKKIKITH